MLVLYITVLVKLSPQLAPRSEDVGWKEKVRSLPKILPLLALALLVLGTLYTGVTTVTEAAGLGVVGAFVLSIFSGNLALHKFASALVNTTRTTGMIFLIVFGGMLFAFLMTSLEIPQELSKDIVAFSENRWVILIAINIILLFLGCFLDAIAIIVITVPFLGPIIEGLGFDLIWFGVMITINAEIGLITPPVGLNLFILRGITPPEVRWKDIILGSLPFTLVLMGAIVLIMVFPDIVLWLPSQMK
jgi:C4-dicarboxylate transporter DctM subunit